jgi:hypothetical protein
MHFQSQITACWKLLYYQYNQPPTLLLGESGLPFSLFSFFLSFYLKNKSVIQCYITNSNTYIPIPKAYARAAQDDL